MNATDATTGASCFGANFVSTIASGVTAAGNVGVEVDTWEQSGAVITDRIGQQIVDVQGPTFGTQAIRDDVGLSLNNQYAPSSTLGFKVGFEFGRTGGNFPVSTNGTLFAAQGSSGSRFTVLNGIDWHLGNFTGNTWNNGHTILTGGGEIIMAKIADPYSSRCGSREIYSRSRNQSGNVQDCSSCRNKFNSHNSARQHRRLVLRHNSGRHFEISIFISQPGPFGLP